MLTKQTWRSVAAALALSLAAVTAVACGGSDGDNERKADTTAPEDKRAPAADVAAGLGKIDALMGRINLSIAADAESAKDQAAGIEDLWHPIEGTIRENDTDLYIRFEDDFATLTTSTGSGDATRTQSTTADVSAAVKAYLAKYPG